MRKLWIVVLVSIAAAHFAATAWTHLYASSNCRQSTDPGCQAVVAAASALSFPSLPIARQFSTGVMGWRRAFVVFAGNSVLVSAVLTGAIWLVAGAFRDQRAA